MPTDPRRFQLHRSTDVTNVSGTGIVADGIQWPDGTISIRWRGDRPSVVFWQRAEDALHVHGHAGSTQIMWLDEPEQAIAEMDAASVWVVPKEPADPSWLAPGGRVWVMSQLNADDMSPAEAREFAAGYLAAADAAEAGSAEGDDHE